MVPAVAAGLAFFAAAGGLRLGAGDLERPRVAAGLAALAAGLRLGAGDLEARRAFALAMAVSARVGFFAGDFDLPGIACGGQ